MNRTLKILATMVFGLTVLAGCKESSVEKAEQKNSEARAKQLVEASNEVPVPDTSNFLTRRYVSEYMKRMDVPSKVFYTYLQGVNGQSYQYIVGTRPISLCALMTPPKKWWEDKWGSANDQLGPAPTLDGVYYGGNGSGICNIYYAFDAESGALIMFKTQNMTVSDQPLSLDVKAVRLKVDKDAEKTELTDSLKKDLNIK